MQYRSRMIAYYFAASLGIASAAQAQEEPDLAREARIHNLYKKHHEVPTIEEEWQKALQDGSTQTYTVQEGDTLWGISETLFGDPQFYPKIWSLNGKEILNPHEIMPEYVVHFTEGTFGEPPSLNLKDKAAAGEANGNLEAGAADPNSSIGDSEIPAEIPKTKPFRSLPPSLAPWEPDPSAKNQFIFNIKPPDKKVPIPEVYLETYLQEGSIEGTGVISENEVGHSSSGDDHYLFVKMKAPPTQNRFLVVKKTGEIKDPKSGNMASQVLVQAEIEVQDIVNTKESLYRAKVLNLVNQIDIGSVLIVGDLVLMSSKEELAPSPAKTTIIGGAFAEDRQLFGTDEVVFLNEGSEKGMAPGQVLPIFRDQTLRNEATEAIQNQRVIGRLKILKVTPKFSSAIVTRAIEEIRVGDRTASE